MAPAGNNKFCQKSMNDTFLLSNIVPQDINNNGDFWNRLEIYARWVILEVFKNSYFGIIWLPLSRDLTKKYSDVRVISGPLWIAKELNEKETENLQKADAKLKRHRKKMPKYLRYEVIGENEVSVPTHLFKIILVEDPKLDKPLLASFVVPNLPIKFDKVLMDFHTSLGSVERMTGFKFYEVWEY